MKALIDKALIVIYGMVLTESCQPKFKYLVKQEKAPVKGLYLFQHDTELFNKFLCIEKVVWISLFELFKTTNRY